MIKINLLGDYTALDYSNRYIFAAFIFGFITFAVFAMRIYSTTASEISELSVKANTISNDLKALEQKTKVVKDLETKKDALKDKLVVLAKLRKNKIGPVRVLDDLNIAVPEKVWLMEASEKDSSIKLVGRAVDNQDIAFFIKRLQESDYFTNVDLIESRLMYYSRSSGKVTSSPEGLGGGGSNNSAFKVRGQEQATRSRLIADKYVKIKEFTIQTAVNYAGKLASVAASEEVYEQSPEVAEIENLEF